MSQSRSGQAQKIPGKKQTHASLQMRLVLFVLFTALIPLIIIAVRDIIQTQQALTNSAEFSLKSSAKQTANSVDTFIQTTLDSISIESQFSDFAAYLSLDPSQRLSSPEQVRTQDLLNKLSRKDAANILSYALVDTDGTVLLSSANQNTHINEAEEAYFLQVQFTNAPIVTAITYIDQTTTVMTFASRVLNINGKYIGILRVNYNSSILQTIVVNSSGGDTDTLILLLDQLNIRLADSQNPSLIQKSITPLILMDYLFAVDSKRFLDLPREEQATNFVDLENALGNAAEQPFFRVDITPNIPGDDTVAVAFMESQPWVVTYSRPTSIFVADVQKQTRTNIILVIGASILITIIATVVARTLTNPIIALTKTANSISQGNLNARAEVNKTDEIGSLALAFNSMTDQLQSTLTGLEERISERTADLQKSNLELETIAEVGRDIAIIRDLNTLLNVAANLIRERFNYYHVAIFLADGNGQFAYLRAASGGDREQMLEKNNRIRIGQASLIGNAIRTGRAQIALDTNIETAGFNNPFLPDTRSEISLPLRSHNITIGALDIHAKTPDAFGERDTPTLQILADQLAATIENAQLAQRVEETLKDLTSVNRLQTEQAWRTAIDEQETPAFEYDGLEIKAVPQNLPVNLLQQLENGKSIVLQQSAEDSENKYKNTLMVPLMALNQVIGVIGLEQEDPDYIWSDQEIAIAQAAANRAMLTLENARLLDESQRRAIKERTILDSTARIGSAINIENILQTTAEELEKILSGSEVTLQFQTVHDEKPVK